MVEEEMELIPAAEAEDVAMLSGTDDEGVVAELVVINEVKTKAQRQRERLLQRRMTRPLSSQEPLQQA